MRTSTLRLQHFRAMAGNHNLFVCRNDPYFHRTAFFTDTLTTSIIRNHVELNSQPLQPIAYFLSYLNAVFADAAREN
jgi:hypothetical protein